MKLLKLYSNNPSFHDIQFNPTGLSIIMGETSQSGENASLKGNCNGVGKTTALRLVNFCLAANSNEGLKKIPKEWSFFLEFELNGQNHRIERSVGNNTLALDDKAIKLARLQKFFDENGPFLIDKNVSGLSFRSLITRFMRHRREDISDEIYPVSSDQKPSDATIRSLYLLGAAYLLAERKKLNAVKLNNIRNQIKQYKEIKKNSKNNELGIDADLASHKQRLERLKAQLENMNIFEAFDDIRREIKDKEEKIETLFQKISINNYQLTSINKALDYTPDMTADELKGLYEGLKKLFKESALEHFDKVEVFHKQMAENRTHRLECDKQQIQAENERLNNEYLHLKESAKRLEAQLKNRHSENEYQALLQEKNMHELEIERLGVVQKEIAALEQQQAKMRSIIANDNFEATKYVASSPLDCQSGLFQQLMLQFGEDIPAGIFITANGGNNQIQFDLKVSAQSGKSTGITHEMTLAYDWLLLTHGSNHDLGFVWHDNALFADIDAGHRAKWMEFIYQNSIDTGKQYIMSINSENFEKSSPYWSEDILQKLQERVIMKLSGEKDTDKLLGIYFDDK